MNNSFSFEEKREISKNIKDISLEMVEMEMNKLIEIGESANLMSERSKIGNNVVDYFTFQQRLETKGKYNASFFDFLFNIDSFREKKFIQTMLKYYKEVKNKNNTKNNDKVLKEVYNICISAINIMRPLNCMELYTRFKAKKVLNFCAGWGGSTIAAAALNIDSWYGIEINNELKKPYENMIEYLKSKSKTEYGIYFGDAATFDYSTIDYDTVFASPPYYFIEKYANNIGYKSKKEMDEQFYKPLFDKTWTHLKKGGHFCLNVPEEVYKRVLVKMLGRPKYFLPLPKTKRTAGEKYKEFIYVWIK
jgi:16S rRNA G966 N2-methylase RsmD